jgi:surface antigen
MALPKRTTTFVAFSALAGLAVVPANAQFGSLLRRVPQAAVDSSKAKPGDNGGCPKGTSGSRAGRGILGGVINDTLGSAAGRAGIRSFVPIAEVSGALTNAIACKLDAAEQIQAAAATEVATRGEAVGSTSSWTSETRDGVSGTSTVVARSDEAGGRRCMNVTDFVIVEGEETRVTKRMCKEPGAKRYVIAEA